MGGGEGRRGEGRRGEERGGEGRGEGVRSKGTATIPIQSRKIRGKYPHFPNICTIFCPNVYLQSGVFENIYYWCGLSVDGRCKKNKISTNVKACVGQNQ